MNRSHIDDYIMAVEGLRTHALEHGVELLQLQRFQILAIERAQSFHGHDIVVDM